MSIRGAENNGSAGAERRAGGGQRIHFEALVAVGEPRGGGFEAESVDVSPEGMRLRTAYLPEIGDKLTCRFDSAGAEIVAEGEVIWRNQEARGGEFGVHFVGLDAATAEAIRAMCAPPASEEPAAAAPTPAMPRGARVRLHIDGLGSPMKARVREAASKDVEVGSNLEFLKVGRSLELEDVEQGKKREAWIDGVKVDVDPATSIPQLVVTLRYEAAAAAATTADKSAKRSSKTDTVDPPTRRTAPPPAPEERKSVADAEAAADDVDDGEDHEVEKEGVGARAARAGLAVAGKIGPTLSGMGSRAKGAMSGIVAAIQKKREERAEVEKQSAPRRTTAPAPGGGLKSEGRRLVREDGAEEAEEAAAPPPPRMNRRAAAIGGALGLTAVLVIFGVSRSLGAHGAANAASADATVASASASASASAAPIAAAQLPAGAASGTPVANVPLFGATPLSTTEPVPPPAAPSASAAALAGSPPDGDSAGPSGEGDDDGPTDAKGGSNLKEWGQGTVSHPIVLKIKMDGPVDRINGASGAMGFTISLPDRRALSTSSDLARKDKRLASVNVVNTSHGAEVTVQFKDGVPPYKARAKGDRLEIALGTEHGASKKVAKKKSDKPKSGGKKKSAH